jgi:hypothetical protein
MVSGKSAVVVLAVISLRVCAPLHAKDMVVGVNVVNPLRASVADQNALLAQLKAAGVRCALSRVESTIRSQRSTRARAAVTRNSFAASRDRINC